MANLVISNTLDGTVILEKLRQNYKKGEKQLIIVPDRVVLSYEMKTLEYLDIVGSFDIEVVSFSRLADLCLKKQNKKILNYQSQMMLIRKVIEENKSQLLYYKNVSSFIGFSKEVLKLINQIGFNNISSNDLQKLLEVLPEKYKKKTQDILLIYNQYLESVKNNCYDAVSKLQLLKEAAERGEYSDYNIYICEFIYFNKIESEIIFSMLDKQDLDKNFYIGVLESNEENKHIYPKTRQDLEAVIKRAGCKCEKEYINEELPYEFEEIRKNLFSYKIPQNDIKTDKVQLMVATDIEEEVEGVAHQIKSIISKGENRFKDISIVCCDLDNYKSTIQSIFKRYNIPYYMDVKTNLYNQNYIKQLLFACRVVLNGYRQEDVLAYLKEIATNKTASNIDCFENYILKYGINYETGFKKEFNFGEKIELENAKHYQNVLIHNMQSLEDISGNCVKDYINAIKRFMQESNAENVCEDLAIEQEDQGLIIDSSITRQVCGKLNEILSQIELILGDFRMNFEEFYQILDSTISSQEISTIPMYIDCVYVGEVEKTRYLKKDYMFVVGANDGLFPKEVSSSGLISAQEYLEWNKRGVCIYPNVYDDNSIERLSVLTILLKANKGLQVSFSKSDISGEELQASPVIEYLQDILKIDTYSFGKILDDTPMEILIQNLSNKDSILLELIRLKEQVEKSQLRYEGNVKKIMDSLYYIACSMYGKNVVEEILNNKERLEASLNLDKIDKSFSAIGKLDSISISKIEKYLKCPFTYYMDYILNVKEREISSVKARDNGTVIHAMMEAFFKNENWENIEDVNQFVEDELVNYVDKHKEYAYLLEDDFRLTKTNIVDASARTLMSLREKMKATLFRPKFIEYHFGNKDNKSVEINIGKRKLILKGVIDRVDIYENKCLVIDYKTKSEIEFKYKDVWNGERVQPLMYLKVLMETKGYIPAGAYYFLVNNYILKKNKAILKYIGWSNSDVLSLLDKTLDGNNLDSNLIDIKKETGNSAGTILSTEDFRKICNYTYDLVQNAAREIEEGYIASSPKGEKNCEYCNYKSICNINNHLERKRKGFNNDKAIKAKLIGGDN